MFDQDTRTEQSIFFDGFAVHYMLWVFLWFFNKIHLFFKEIAAKTNTDDLGEGSKIKIIRREGAKANTIVVVNPNGKVKSLHWRMITKPEQKKTVNEEETNNGETNNESGPNKNQESKNDVSS